MPIEMTLNMALQFVLGAASAERLRLSNEVSKWQGLHAGASAGTVLAEGYARRVAEATRALETMEMALKLAGGLMAPWLKENEDER